VDLWQILEKLQTSLEYQKKQSFFGLETAKGLEQLHKNDLGACDELKSEFLVSYISIFCNNVYFQEFYESAVDYLKKWIEPYRDSVPPELTNWMICEKDVSITEVIKCAEKLLPDLQLTDEIAEEIAELNASLQQLKIEKFDKMTVAEKWSLLLKNENFKLLAQIVDAVFAISCSNAECERIFSLMNVQWTDERNSLKLETVSRIVSLLVNCDSISCLKMFTYLKSIVDIGKKIRNADKYDIVM